ncbi:MULTISPECIES: malate synthase A [unclassified Paenibacillus]|uniref:malate synthase A n=1 Tax=unclassified Paenibacillus TaxID=185978 RepID=UPI0009563F9C|nr:MULTISPECIES: malate synthase A [unclassified Paenibacillus]ASS65329.1 malate synthase A [Paenibacillus sp. RUD330]SIQ39673.1 malate synthase [Paenibacillus sp. RU4X]SIQ61855.1 malate synthase [Paenibacillus sp. RU4T]
MSRPAAGLAVLGPPLSSAAQELLGKRALAFVQLLEQQFGHRRRELLQARQHRQQRFDGGEKPDFRSDTLAVRTGEWSVAPAPAELRDRRVEITGPAGDRKMVINALNSGARVFMCDLEDANSPTWANTMNGQLNIRDAEAGTIAYESPEGKAYRLAPDHAVIKIRPRGWHLEESHVAWEGQSVSAALFDFGMAAFHNAREKARRGSGLYFYLPKLESMEEAELWEDVFTFAERELGLERGMFRATVLIETLPAAFEMEEILFVLRDHADGLNCGRWDYIFSYIKKLRAHPEAILPDRSLVTMDSPFMAAYARLAVQTCHRRGAFCIGGMAAQIPIKNDSAANEQALDKVRLDKLREVRLGHDGTWVAHPGLVAVAEKVFNEHMPGDNQLFFHPDGSVGAEQLLEAPRGPITEAGVRLNLSVSLQYIEAWLRGTGAVPINSLMEDAATAEISRAQLWQWIRHPQGILEDGRKMSADLYRKLLEEELGKLPAAASGAYGRAEELLTAMTLADTFAEFLTVDAYRYLQD